MQRDKISILCSSRNIIGVNVGMISMNEIFKLKKTQLNPHACYPKVELDEYTFDQLVDWSIENAAIKDHVYVILTPAPVVIGGLSYARAYFEGYPYGDIPAKIIDSDDTDSVIKTMYNSVLTELKLCPIEEAKYMMAIKGSFKLTDVEIAKLLGVARATVTNSMKLLTLHKSVQSYVSKGLISKQSGKYLVSASKHEQPGLAITSITRGWSSRQLYNAINPSFVSKQDKQGSKRRFKKTADVLKFEEGVSEILGLPTEFTPADVTMKSGDLSFHFNSFDEFGRLMQLIDSRMDSSVKFEGRIALSNMNYQNINDLLGKILTKTDQ